MDEKLNEGLQTNEMEKGLQPLDGILTELKLKNADLVLHSKEQLSFKVVAKGRRGRRLTVKAQLKILKALNLAQTTKQFELKEIFNYKGQ